MNNKSILYLVFLVVGGMGLLLLINLSNFLVPGTTAKFISLNDVSGVATKHKGKLYTLNFDQQKRLIALFNRSVHTGFDTGPSKSDFDFENIIIYRLGKPAIEIKPIAVAASQLIFSSPDWDETGLLRETGPGEIITLIDQTYDK